MTGRKSNQWLHELSQTKLELNLLGGPLGCRSQRKFLQLFRVHGLGFFKCSRDTKSLQVLFTPLNPPVWLQHFHCLPYDWRRIILCHNAKEKSNVDNVSVSLVDFSISQYQIRIFTVLANKIVRNIFEDV